MADPVEEILQATPRVSRAQQFAEKGVPKDVNVAKARIRASRRTRRRPVPRAAIGGTVPGPLAKALEAISDRYDVARNAVLRRFVEDGVRKYGTADEIAAAGLRPPSDFDEFRPTPIAVPQMAIPNQVEWPMLHQVPGSGSHVSKDFVLPQSGPQPLRPVIVQGEEDE